MAQSEIISDRDTAGIQKTLVLSQEIDNQFVMICDEQKIQPFLFIFEQKIQVLG